jgi:hypothetical protein
MELIKSALERGTHTAESLAKVVTEAGILSKAVGVLGMMVSHNPNVPHGTIEELLRTAVLNDYDDESLQRADRTVNNLRLLWRSPIAKR